MKRYSDLTIYFTIFIIALSSCDLNYSPFRNSLNIPQSTSVQIDDLIEGEYVGSIDYWMNGDSSVSHFSMPSGYLTSVIRQDTLFTISFDSTFMYTISDIDFELEQRFIPRKTIVLSPGQVYTQWTYPAGSFNTITQDNITSIWYHLSIRSIPPDSTYFLSFYGIRYLP